MFFNKTENGYILRVRLMPNSSSCRTNGVIMGANEEEFLKINIISVPEKGKANKELIEFLSDKLDLAKSSIEIIGGTLDRWKKIKLPADENLETKLLKLGE